MSIRTIEYTQQADGTYRRDPNTATEKYVGAVLCDREHNYYDDSDGYSHVWDGETVTYVGTWTTRFADNHAGTTVDAYDGPYVQAITDYLREWCVRAMLAEREQKYDADAYDERRPEVKGRVVRVVKGRKVPVGTQGEVIWVGERQHSYHVTETRVGIRDSAGTVHWTNARNCEVVNPVVPNPEDYVSEQQMRATVAGLDLRALHGVFCSHGARAAGLVRI